MKTLILFIIFCLTACASKQKHLIHYLSSGVENIKIFPTNEKDSARINTINTTSEKSIEECKKLKNATCIDDRSNLVLNAVFPKGIHEFRSLLFKKFKLPKNAKEGENRVRVIIGTHNTIEKIEILKYTDLETKKAIEDVFKLRRLNTWTSASIYGIPVNEQFETSIFVVRK